MVVFYPPMPERLKIQSTLQRARFRARLAPHLIGCTIVDFNNSELVNESGFVDSAHLTNAYFDRVVKSLPVPQ